MSHKQKTRVSDVMAWGVVGLGALLLVAPFYFTFVFATHGRTEIWLVKLGPSSGMPPPGVPTTKP